MNQYTIHCTEEQTKKAFELGAPIVTLPNYEEFKGFPFVRCKNGNEYPCQIPTAEQMIGWLEKQNILIEYTRFMGKYACRLLELHDNGERNLHIQTIGSSRQEATLNAIDAALDYLIKMKE